MGERSTVQLLVPAPSFQLQGRDGRLHPTGPVPPAVHDGVDRLGSSGACDGLTLGASDRGISARRRTVSGSEWAYDLWIAEFVADLLSSGG